MFPMNLLYTSSPICSNFFKNCFVCLMYTGMVGSWGLRMWSKYLDIDSVRVPIPDMIGLSGRRISRDWVGIYGLLLEGVVELGFTVVGLVIFWRWFGLVWFGFMAYQLL